jgi:hypothetical protein
MMPVTLERALLELRAYDRDIRLPLCQQRQHLASSKRRASHGHMPASWSKRSLHQLAIDVVRFYEHHTDDRFAPLLRFLHRSLHWQLWSLEGAGILWGLWPKTSSFTS